VIIKPVITASDVAAVRCVILGTASPEQQRQASDWLMREAARVNDLAFFEDNNGGGRASEFALGRQYVGHLWRQMLLPETMTRAKQHDQQTGALAPTERA
jgi:protein gp37